MSRCLREREALRLARNNRWKPVDLFRHLLKGLPKHLRADEKCALADWKKAAALRRTDHAAGVPHDAAAPGSDHEASIAEMASDFLADDDAGMQEDPGGSDGMMAAVPLAEQDSAGVSAPADGNNEGDAVSHCDAQPARKKRKKVPVPARFRR